LHPMLPWLTSVQKGVVNNPIHLPIWVLNKL
jgi:hypothetical protein